MRKLLLLIPFILFLSSCTNNQVDGTYFLIKSNGREGLIGGLINEITFRGDHCSFNYFGINMSGSISRENNYIFINTGTDLGTLSMEILDKQTLEGEGYIGGTFKHSDYFRAKSESNLGFYKATNALHIRAGAGTNYSIIITINKGDRLSLIKDLGNGWSQIEYGDFRGFVSTKYLTKE
jgi:hypothetical protein